MLQPSQKISLYNPNFGVKTKTRMEFVDQFGLSKSTLCLMRQGKIKNHRGWKISENT